LFVEATYRPFHDFVTDYVRRWTEQGYGADTAAHNTEVFVDGLYRLLHENRGLLGAMSESATGGAPELAAATAVFLREVFDQLEGEVVLESGVRGTRSMDAAYAVRFTFALVFGVSVLGEALFPPGGQPKRALIVEEMSGFVLRGASIQEP
jgi:hypothetical protein